MKHPSAIPSLVFADSNGNISDLPDLSMIGKSCGNYKVPSLEDLIPLPEGSELFVLPQRLPVGGDYQTGEPLLVEENPFAPRQGVQAVAAFMAPAHTAILSTAFETRSKTAPLLPLFSYCAVGWHDDRFWVTGFRSDPDIRQDAAQFSRNTLEQRTKKELARYPNNRLIQHIGTCCLTYCCPAAQNYFMGRWEAPLPSSPFCNANCLGCISLQPSGTCPSTQQRITFVPTAEEICELALRHIERADKAIVSFGQGCEGEPLLQADTLEKAIIKIRQATAKGTINLNSNASLPAKVKRLASAGLDALRISMNSAQEVYYSRYYRPSNYRFQDVLDSINAMKDAGKFVSLNYFVLPGLTDSPAEYDALCKLIETYHPDLIQLRNLNIDPEWYLSTLQFSDSNGAMGIRHWHKTLSNTFPKLRFGYFNPYLNQ